MDLTQKHCLVTGGAKRLGRAIAASLLDKGARVTVHYHRSKAEAQQLKAQFPAIELVQADFADIDSIRRMVQTAQGSLGPVDVLVNSASRFYRVPTFEITEQIWDEFHATNLKGHFFLCQEVGKIMSRRGGVILNLCDVHAERPLKNFAAYTCAKAGLLMLTRQLACEWAPKVRVNAISPGTVLLPEGYSEGQKHRAIERTLLGHLGDPRAITEAVLFLIQNDYLTGIDLKVDGGRSLV